MLSNLSRTDAVSQRNIYIVGLLLSLVFGEFATVLGQCLFTISKNDH